MFIKKISIISGLLVLGGVSHGSTHSSLEGYDFCADETTVDESSGSFRQNINFLLGSLLGYMVDQENFETVDPEQREFYLELCEILRGNEIQIKKESIDSMIKRMKGIVVADRPKTRASREEEGIGENMTENEPEKIHQKTDRLAHPMKIKKHESVFPKVESMSINEIMHAISEENGMFHTIGNSGIFNGSAKEELKTELQPYFDRIEKYNFTVVVEEDLETLLDQIEEYISSLNELIDYANFEFSSYYSLKEINNYKKYYEVKKSYFEKIKDLITVEIKRKVQ
ncbi:MAG: hypothetical protein LBI77_02795 [Puniceicoccales bacterium]|jgi:hypothetical protein|nr:hypothetical protein [Puniceicoccales bacterium]